MVRVIKQIFLVKMIGLIIFKKYLITIKKVKEEAFISVVQKWRRFYIPQ